MKGKKLTVFATSAWLVLMLVALSLGAYAQPAGGYRLKVAVFPFSTNDGWIALLAQEKGYFSKEGLEVTLIQTYEQMPALIGGSADIILTSGEQAILATNKGEDILVVGLYSPRPTQAFVARSQIKTPGDLKGKILGVSNIPSGDMFLIQQFLAKEGVGLNEVRFLKVGGSRDRYAALQAGRIDAATFATPFVARMKQERGFTLLNTPAYWKPMAWANLMVKRTWAKSHADALVKFLRASYRTLDWLNDPVNLEEATRIVRPVSGHDEATQRETFRLERESGVYVPTKITPALLQLHADMLLQQKILTKPFDVGKVVDSSYWERAIK